MAKSQDKETQTKPKDRKHKERKALVGRVKKVIKKSRRRLTEEKFEKELQRTIAFLEQMQATLDNNHAKTPSPEGLKAALKAAPNAKAAAKPVKTAAAKPAVKSNGKPGAKPGAKKAVSKSKQ